MRDYFQVFDFILVLSIFVSFVVELFHLHDNNKLLGKVRYMVSLAKLFRELRPLRLVKVHQIRDTVESLFHALPSIGNVIILNFIAIYIFSIFGM